MSKKKYHFEIPNENIIRRKINKTGRAETIYRNNYSEHGRSIYNQKEEFKNSEFQKKDLKAIDEFFLQISTLEKFSLKKYLPQIENLGFQLVSLSDNKSVGNVKITKLAFEEFEQKLDVYITSERNKYKSYFSAIEKINSIPNEVKIPEEIGEISNNEEIDIIVNFFSGLSSKNIFSLQSILNEEFAGFKDTVDFNNIGNKIINARIKINKKDIINLLNNFNSIKSIQINNSYFITNSIKGENIPEDIYVEEPQSSSAICIIDSGITTQGSIMPRMVRTQILSYLPKLSNSIEASHGTFVASRCIFGDDIEYQITNKTLFPYCYVIDVPVFGLNSDGLVIGLSDFDLSNAITEIVESMYSSIKVYNLSLGSFHSLIDYQRTNLANTLDVLSKKYDVLFIISSGNITNSLGSFPRDHFKHLESRIGSPAESLLSLTVGSIAKYEYSYSLSPPNNISPFSKIGPGTDGGMKPELVAHGGNILAPYNLLPFNRISTCGLFSDGKSISYDNGTSFSAPIISRYCQMLFDYYPFAKSNLVKSLLLHFTENIEAHNEIGFNLNFTGFGEPVINNALYAEKNATFLYQGALDQENYDYVKFHIPNIFADKSLNSKLHIKVTIVFNPEVDVNNNIEYSCCRISAKLIKNTKQGLKAVSFSNHNYYKQWSPIIQFEKSFDRNYLTGEWFLSLRLYTRGNIEQNYKQDYAVVIEVTDQNGNINVYDEIYNDEALNYYTHEKTQENINYA